jgi:hypothetical protein
MTGSDMSSLNVGGVSGGGTPAAAAAPAAAHAAAPAASGGFNAGSLLKYAPMALAGGGMLYDVMKGNKPPEYSPQLSAQAAQMQAQGQQLSSYLASGTLPPGIQAGLDSAHAAAAATIRSQYASRGQSGSSAEATDIANLNQTVVAQGAQIATNLLAQGISESEFSSQIYANLMETSIAQDQQLSNSIATFAGALGKGGISAAA